MEQLNSFRKRPKNRRLAGIKPEAVEFPPATDVVASVYQLVFSLLALPILYRIAISSCHYTVPPRRNPHSCCATGTRGSIVLTRVLLSARTIITSVSDGLCEKIIGNRVR